MSQVQVLQGEPLSESSVERLGFSFICSKPFPSPSHASPAHQHPHFISTHITENRAIKQSKSFTSVSLATATQPSLDRDSHLQTFTPSNQRVTHNKMRTCLSNQHQTHGLQRNTHHEKAASYSPATTPRCARHTHLHICPSFSLASSTLFYLLSTTESRFIIRSNLLRCVFEACLHDIF